MEMLKLKNISNSSWCNEEKSNICENRLLSKNNLLIKVDAG